MHKTKPESIQGEIFKVRYGLLLLQSERKIQARLIGTVILIMYIHHICYLLWGLQSTAQAVRIPKERRKKKKKHLSDKLAERPLT